MAPQTSPALRLVERNTFLVAEPNDGPAAIQGVFRCSSSPCLFHYVDSEAKSECKSCNGRRWIWDGTGYADCLVCIACAVKSACKCCNGKQWIWDGTSYADCPVCVASEAESEDCSDSEVCQSVQQCFPNTDDEVPEPARRAERAGGAVKRRGFPLRHHCHFPVGIEQDERFNVVKRLLGAEAENLRSVTRLNHGSKIQIQGRGASRRETSNTDEPLVICVSTPSKPKLERVVAAMEALLRGVQRQYQTFCREEGLPVPSLHVARLPGLRPEML